MTIKSTSVAYKHRTDLSGKKKDWSPDREKGGKGKLV